jgi:hypothetical protein
MQMYPPQISETADNNIGKKGDVAEPRSGGDNIIQLDDNKYLYYGQFERTDELDKRIYEITLTTTVPLRPNMESRPMETRHAIFPMISTQFHQPSISNRKYLEYDTTKVFSSIQSNGPVEGYLNNIDSESSLRNQYTPLQHGAIQTTYIPSSKSDLFVVNVPLSSSTDIQPFPLLFEKHTYHTTGNKHISSQIGHNAFNNASKQQLRNL